MRGTYKFLLVLGVAFLLMLAFRALVFSVYTINGAGLEPMLCEGDRVLVNRWSYGLRTGDGLLFDYGRLWRQAVRRGDLIAFEDPRDEQANRILICRCKAVPGDTIVVNREAVEVPGIVTCADCDYFWLEAVGGKNTEDSRTLGFIPERCIIGRACLVVYSHAPQYPLWDGYWSDRFLLPL